MTFTATLEPPSAATSLPEPAQAPSRLHAAVERLAVPFHCTPDGDVVSTPGDASDAIYAPPFPLERLGDAGFVRSLGLKYAYVAGAMANGIGSCELVETLGRAGMLGFFGAAGLPLPRVEAAIARLQSSLGEQPFGVNLIHSPNEPALENGAVDLFIRHRVRLIEASAYLDLTLPVVRYRTSGIRRHASGRVEVPNRVVAKVSRVEVARKFLSPPPEKHLQELLRRGELSPEQVAAARQVPMADALTAEADSAGHTDNRPAVTLLPTLVAARDRMADQYAGRFPLWVGLAGGLATPAAVAAAFAMGAAYVVTGSVNQACVESGTSSLVREMLAQAEQADTTMAPAADMFEMGVRVQVLKRGTLFAMRAAKLYDLYRTYPAWNAIPATERANLEKHVFQGSFDQIWDQTEAFFRERDPRQLERAANEPKHKMALVFRWYLGLSSHWANAGDPHRKIDYQIWCGPAMGAFNEWTQGTFLAEPGERRAVTVAMNLLYGAAVMLRGRTLQWAGVSHAVPTPRPLPVADILTRLAKPRGAV
jgi:PfaD family protein